MEGGAALNKSLARWLLLLLHVCGWDAVLLYGPPAHQVLLDDDLEHLGCARVVPDLHAAAKQG